MSRCVGGGGQQVGGLLGRGGHRLLDQDVLAGRERRLRERTVLVHARQHEHDVDVLAGDDRTGLVVGSVHAEPFGGCGPLGRVGVVAGDQPHPPLVGELGDEGRVGALEHAAESEDSDAQGHGVVVPSVGRVEAVGQGTPSARCHGNSRGSSRGCEGQANEKISARRGSLLQLGPV